MSLTRTLTPKGLATRTRIVEGTAEHLRGTDDGEVTLDEVCAITRTSKGQLFHYFPGGKEELLLEVVRLEARRVLDDQRPWLDDLGTWASWQRWRDAVVERYRAQGDRCPLGSLMRQAGGTPGAEEVVRSLLEGWQAQLEDGVRAMQESGAARADLSCERTAAALLAGVQGGVLLLRSTGETTHLEAALDLALDVLRPVERP